MQNQGTAFSFEMVLIEDTLGDINTDIDGNLVGYSAPWLFENSTGGISAIIGTEHGAIYYVDQVNPDPTSTWAIDDSSAFGVMNGLRACPTLFDINNDLLPDLFNGDLSGGLGLYMGGPPPNGFNETARKDGFLIYPNPSSGIIQFKLATHNGQGMRVSAYDISGRIVYTRQLDQDERSLDLSSLKNGAYLLEMKNESFLGITRFIKE